MLTLGTSWEMKYFTGNPSRSADMSYMYIVMLVQHGAAKTALRLSTNVYDRGTKKGKLYFSCDN